MKASVIGAATLIAATSGSAFANAPTYGHAAVARWVDDFGPVRDGVACPDGEQVVMSGMGVVSYGNITALGPVEDASSIIGAASLIEDGSGYRIDVDCVDPAVLARSVSVTAASVQTTEGAQVHHPTATCPAGTVPYGGAVFTEEDGAAVTSASKISADYPTASGWRGATTTILGPDQTFRVKARCLPRGQLGDTVTVTKRIRVSSRDGGYYQAVARCPQGHVAFNGGAWWSDFGSGDSYLTMSTMNKTNSTWVARGWTSHPATLRARITCTDRLG